MSIKRLLKTDPLHPRERVHRADLIVEDQVIVEIKSVTNLAPIHEAQLLSYLKL